MQIKVTKILPNAKLPEKTIEGYEVFAGLPGMGQSLKAGEISVVRTGIRIALPAGYSIQPSTDAYLAINRHLVVLGKNPEDELCLVMQNVSSRGISLGNGDPIGRIRFIKTEQFELSENLEAPALSKPTNLSKRKP